VGCGDKKRSPALRIGVVGRVRSPTLSQEGRIMGIWYGTTLPRKKGTRRFPQNGNDVQVAEDKTEIACEEGNLKEKSGSRGALAHGTRGSAGRGRQGVVTELNMLFQVVGNAWRCIDWFGFREELWGAQTVPV